MLYILFYILSNSTCLASEAKGRAFESRRLHHFNPPQIHSGGCIFIGMSPPEGRMPGSQDVLVGLVMLVHESNEELHVRSREKIPGQGRGIWSVPHWPPEFIPQLERASGQRFHSGFGDSRPDGVVPVRPVDGLAPGNPRRGSQGWCDPFQGRG